MTDERDAPEYIVEYIDGPMAGSTERRILISGEIEDEVTAIAAIEGDESMFRYLKVDSREIQGEYHARYRFDARDSDTVIADPEDNRANDSDFR